MASYQDIQDRRPNAVQVTLQERALVYEEPTWVSPQVDTLTAGDTALVHERIKDMYGVATPSEGHVGYIAAYLTDLPADQAPEALDRTRAYREIARRRAVAAEFPGERPSSARRDRYRSDVNLNYVYQKDPATAVLLSVLVVGGGHFYAGESGTGFFLLGSSLVASTAGFLATTSTLDTTCSGTFDCESEPNYTPLILGVVYSAGAYLYGIIDSARATHEFNQRQHRLTIGPTYEGREGIGLVVRAQL